MFEWIHYVAINKNLTRTEIKEILFDVLEHIDDMKEYSIATGKWVIGQIEFKFNVVNSAPKKDDSNL